MMALVLLVMACSSSLVSMFRVLFTSKNTGIAPNCTIGAIVVGNPQATLITSSPLWIARLPRDGLVRAEKAIRLAELPELVVRTALHPKNCVSPSSSCRLNWPAVNQPRSTASCISSFSLSPTTWPEAGMYVLPGMNIYTS